MSKKSSDTILYSIFGILLLSGAGLVYKFVTHKRLGQVEIGPPAQSPYSKPRTLTPPNAQFPSTDPNNRDPVKKIETTLPITEPELALEEKLNLQSQITKKSFTEITLLEMKWPKGLKFIEVDAEDGMEIMYGFNHLTKEGLTAVARPAETSMAEIQQYLKKEADLIPNLKGDKIKSMSPPLPIKEAQQKPGVSSVEVMSATLASGKKAHVALVNRSDKEGSYIFVFTAPAGTIENNDGYVDQIYNSIKILPKKKK